MKKQSDKKSGIKDILQEKWPRQFMLKSRAIGTSLVAQWLRIFLPASAGDTGSSPGLGRIPHAAEQLSPCATTTEPVL